MFVAHVPRRCYTRCWHSRCEGFEKTSLLSSGMFTSVHLCSLACLVICSNWPPLVLHRIRGARWDNVLLARLPRLTAGSGSSSAKHDLEDLFSLTEVAVPLLNAGGHRHKGVEVEVYRLALCCTGDPQSNC